MGAVSRGPGLALIVGLVVGIAVGVGIGALVFNDDSGGGSSSGSGSVSTQAVNLPSSLAGFNDIVDASKAKNADATALKGQQEREDTTRKLTTDAYSKAFNGAAVGYRRYADADLLKLPWVIAVRSPAHQLVIGPVTDPAQLFLGASQQEVVPVGDVNCQIVRNEAVPKGQKPDPSKEVTVECEKTGPKLTVYAGGGGFDGPAARQQMVALVNAAYAAVGGG